MESHANLQLNFMSYIFSIQAHVDQIYTWNYLIKLWKVHLKMF